MTIRTLHLLGVDRRHVAGRVKDFEELIALCPKIKDECIEEYVEDVRQQIETVREFVDGMLRDYEILKPQIPVSEQADILQEINHLAADLFDLLDALNHRTDESVVTSLLRIHAKHHTP